MSAGQRETRRRMIEQRGRPRRGGVACRAIARKPRRCMRGVGRRREILLVTSDASCRDRREIVVRVAGRAGHGNVRTGQRERGFRVVEGRRLPGRRRMAGRTVRWKSVMRRVGCRREVLLVAPHTCRRRRGIGHRRMAARARHRDVRTGEREGGRRMIERRGLPRGCRVATRAIPGEPLRRVRRIRRGQELRFVTVVALRRCVLEPTAGMTLDTRSRRVDTKEDKPGGAVIKPVPPGQCIRRVALDTICSEPRRPVCRLRRRVILRAMAAVAVDGHIDKLELLLVLVAPLARNRHMGPHQGEPGVRVPLPHIRNEPGLRRMASFTLGTELIAVNILMTCDAPRWSIGEHQIRVALDARDTCMLISKDEPGAVMVERKRRANRRPSGRGVAFHASDAKVAMRRCLRGRHGKPRQHEKGDCPKEMQTVHREWSWKNGVLR